MGFHIDCEEGLSRKSLQRVENAMQDFVEADLPLCVELLFVDGEEIHRLNRETRGVDRVTDVLSYPSLEGICGKPLYQADYPFEVDEEGRLLLGSIVLCKDKAKEQAEEYGHSYERELFYLIVHGIMHCLGYDHIEEEDKRLMREQEERILEKMGEVRK